MRVLASIPAALLALTSTVAAAPVADEQPPHQKRTLLPEVPANRLPTEADLKPLWASPPNMTSLPIPESMLLPSGAGPDIFAAGAAAHRGAGVSPRDADPGNELLKRIYDRGGCWAWQWWVDENQRQGYAIDFQWAKQIILGFDRYNPNYIGPMEYFFWDWGTFQIIIRNQDTCHAGSWTWDDMLDMMDDLYYHFCEESGQGWGYLSWYPLVIGTIIYTGEGLPGFQPECA